MLVQMGFSKIFESRGIQAAQASFLTKYRIVGRKLLLIQYKVLLATTQLLLLSHTTSLGFFRPRGLPKPRRLSSLLRRSQS